MKKLGAGKSMKLAEVFGGEVPPVHQTQPGQGTFLNVPVDALKPNPYQPRQIFDPVELGTLVESIKTQGILLPLCIYIDNGTYFIGDGERRWRASKLAGKKTVPCYVTTGNPAEVALIGNMHRSDLNPIEEADAYARMQQEFNHTHQSLASVLGKSRNNITETLSLNKLPTAIKERCLRVDISKRKLIRIARMETPEEMEKAFNEATGCNSNPKQLKPEERLRSQVHKIACSVSKIEKIDWEKATAEVIREMQAVKRLVDSIPALAAPMDEEMQNFEESLNLSGACSTKLLNAGFRIFRSNEYEKVIRELSHAGGWKLVTRHKTKKAMNETMALFLKDPMSIRN